MRVRIVYGDLMSIKCGGTQKMVFESLGVSWEPHMGCSWLCLRVSTGALYGSIRGAVDSFL